MSHSQDASAAVGDEELRPTQTQGYKVGEQKTVDELANLDANDESLNRWKASLGIGAGAGAGDPSKPRVRRGLNSRNAASLTDDMACCSISS